jgi:hypothetical protein
MTAESRSYLLAEMVGGPRDGEQFLWPSVRRSYRFPAALVRDAVTETWTAEVPYDEYRARVRGPIATIAYAVSEVELARRDLWRRYEVRAKQLLLAEPGGVTKFDYVARRGA